MSLDELTDISPLGVTFEAARECINFEIADHRAAINALKKTKDPVAALHKQAVKDLIKIRKQLRPKDPKTSEIVMLLLKSVFRANGKGGTNAS